MAQLEEIHRRLGEIPGVASVGASFSLPLDGYDSNDVLWIEDFPQPPNQLPPIRRFKWIGGDYPVLEIVTFRLSDNVETEEFLKAARETEAFLRQ